MKRRIILALAAIMVFGLAIATVAFSTVNNPAAVAASCCCCSGDSCPLKSKDTARKDASSKDKASCCDGCEHCSGGAESCPMMKDAAHKGEHAKGEHSCCPMMKDASHMSADKTDAAHHDKAMSCPMKNKAEAKASGVSVGAEPVAAKDKTSCDCACCAGHGDKQTVPAV